MEKKKLLVESGLKIIELIGLGLDDEAKELANKLGEVKSILEEAYFKAIQEITKAENIPDYVDGSLPNPPVEAEEFQKKRWLKWGRK